jgi:2',3'-cyclic-nucleotide 2'-phosphodiesterase (5'-nucleotidase family)
MHAGFLPHEAFWIKDSPKPRIGGFNELSYAIDSFRQVKKWTLLLDAGDVMTGNPITEYDYEGASGGALFEMMNLIGYDAWTPGNHDFDISVANLKKLTEIARFTTISANILDTNNMYPVNNTRYLILEKNNLKIGIIGLMSSDFYNLVNKNSSQGIKILSPIKTIQPIVDTLSLQTDLLIALTHEGIEDDSLLAMNVKGLNVIVGGHSHTRLRHPKIVNGVVIVQTGSNCENLGILDLTVENHHIVRSNGELLPLWYNSARGTTPLSLFIDSIKNSIDNDYAAVIAVLKSDWIRSSSESGIGNFIADAQREAAGADVGFMNSSGIRKDMPAGLITKRDLFEILPFRNLLMKFELTGKQIRSIVEFYINEHPGIQISGIKCEWERKLDGSIKFVTFLINGKSLDENKVYFGAASDYMMGEAKKYFGIEIPILIDIHQTVFAAVEKKIVEMKEISSAKENRIKHYK